MRCDLNADRAERHEGERRALGIGDGKPADLARQNALEDAADIVEGAIDMSSHDAGELLRPAVEMDDAALEAFLEGNEPDADTLRKLIRKATVKGAFYPMFCGSAFMPASASRTAWSRADFSVIS